MTARSSVLILALVLSVPPVAARGQSQAQQQADAQLATPKLDASATISSLDLTAIPLREIVETIAKAGGITVRYHSAVTNLDTPSTVKLSNATVEDGLRTVLDPKALAIKVLGRKSVFIYPNTPANRERYDDSLRTFSIVKADLSRLMVTVNRALTPVGADELRPTVVSIVESRTITVRATPETMAKIAKLIADNDK